MDPNIEALLNLQKFDTELFQARSQLELIPYEVAQLEAKVVAVRVAQKALDDEIKELELKRKQADMDLKGVEDQIVKYKTQQLSVKKNEEYQALLQQIEKETSRISGVEDRELEILELIDRKTEENDALKSESQGRIAELEGQVDHLRKQREELDSRIQGLVEQVRIASEGIPRAYISKYEQVIKQVKRPPYVVAIEEGRCEGCHLKASQDVVGLARKGEGVVQCDNCSRIVYWAG